MTPSLLFVYNADSGLFNTFTDIAHKILSPKTYPCKLCAITYDNFGIKIEWAQFIKETKADITFCHRDEFKKKYNIANTKFPCIFTEKGSNIELFITDKDINACESLEELKKLITTKLSQ
ncbi:MAG: hypothetical protein COC01_09160 [Bacteroidetes bacterium]|nr:MAG: hypothetical protein COC01_09160 [Bacteroidota bacterium]